MADAANYPAPGRPPPRRNLRAETARSQVGYVPHQPAVLIVGSREIPVEDYPIARSVEETRSVEVQAGGPDELVIGPRRRSVLGTICLGLVLLAIATLPTVLFLPAPDWLTGVFVAVIVAFGLFLIRAQLRGLRWVRFDRRAGRLVVEHRVGFSARRVEKWTISLGSIIAVQLLHNGLHTITDTTGSDGQQTTTFRWFYGYELNLILDDPDHRRVHLWGIADWPWVRETGHRLGEFLGVPVIDRLYNGG
jgi:hypothetical protein